MESHVKFTREQVLFLSFIGVLGNIVYTHTWIDDDTDRAAWLASLLGILLIIPFAIWILYLGKFHPKSTIFDMIELNLGKFLNTIIITLYIIINIALSVAHLNMFTQLINVFALQYTPPIVIMSSIIFIGILIANGNVKSFARLVEILSIIGILNYFASFIFSFPKDIHVEYLIPIFDTSLIGMIKGIIFITGCASECLLLLMIIVRFIPDSAKHYLWVVKGIILSSIIFSSAILIIIAIMSPELAKRISFGGVNAARLIQVGQFIQGLEIFVFGTYQFIVIGKISICIYCTCTSFKKIFNNKKSLLFLFISAIILLIPSIWLCSYNNAYFLAIFLEKYITLPFSILVLLLASLSIKMQNKKAGSVSK